jgi:hypothetical protein
LVIAIAEGDQINLDANTWYECEARWEVAGGAR